MRYEKGKEEGEIAWSRRKTANRRNDDGGADHDKRSRLALLVFFKLYHMYLGINPRKDWPSLVKYIYFTRIYVMKCYLR